MEKKILDKLDSFNFSLQQKRMLVEVIKDIISSTKDSSSDKPIVQSDPLLPLFEAAGAVYDADTDTYTANEISMINKEDMVNMFVNAIIPNNISHQSYKTNLNLNPSLLSMYTINGNITDGGFTAADSKAEILTIYNKDYIFKIRAFNSSNRNCYFSKYVKKIINVLDFTSKTFSPTALYHPFGECPKLETVYIKNLKVDLYLASSPNITAESIKYLIENAINTDEIVVYVTASVLKKINSNTSEWSGVLENATSKNIRLSDLYSAE